jgi:hypothetical protein
MTKAKNTTLVKAVNSIKYRQPGTGTEGVPIKFVEIEPNAMFECPNSMLKELRAQKAITNLAGVTPSEARENAPVQEGSEGADDVDDQDDDNQDEDTPEPVKLTPEPKPEVQVSKPKAAEKTHRPKPVYLKPKDAVTPAKAKAKAKPAADTSDPDDVM